MGKNTFSKTISNKTRLRILLLTGLLLWTLILHNLLSFRLRVILEYESLRYFLNRIPGDSLSTVVAAATLVTVLTLLIYWLPRRFASYAKTPYLVALLGSAFLIAGCSFLWLQPDHPLPQEWSGVLSLVVGLSLILSTLVDSKRALLLSHVGLLVVALTVGIASQFVSAHRSKTRELRAALETALVDLESKRRAWSELEPSKILQEAHDRANGFGVYRFDDSLLKVKAVEARDNRLEEGVLLDLPREDKFIPVGEDSSFEVSDTQQLFPDYRGESLLRTEAPLGLDPSAIGSIRIRMSVSKGSYFQLFWSEDERMGQLDRIRIPLGTPGKATTYEIKERIIRHRGKGRINHFWLVPSDQDARVVIESFRVLDRAAGVLGGLPFHTGYENVDEQIRSVLFVSAPSRITYEVAVPLLRPRLHFGVNAPDEAVATTFEISIGSNSDETVVFSQPLRNTSRWHDYDIDLAAWAGRTVDVIFKTDAEKQTLGIWSNPVLRGQKAQLPNVVIFLVDSLRADHLGAYGYSENTSPVFDGLASSGVLFERALSNGTMTKHAIPGLFSSNPMSATGVRHGADVLPEAFPTLAEILRAMGYVTAAFTTNGNAGPYSGTHQGFSFLFDAKRIAREAMRGDGSPNAEMVVSDLLRDWIHQNADSNFFLYVHTMDPHGPYDPPEGYRDFDRDPKAHSPVAYSPFFDPPWLPSPSRGSRMALYDGEIAFGDLHLGRFLGILEDAGVRGETLLVFVSDHGEYFGEHGMWGHGPPPFVQGTHIPLLLVGGGTPSGVRVSQTVQQLDILPTILDAVGFDPDHSLFQGTSLLPLAFGRPSPAFSNRLVFIEAASPGDVSFHYGNVHFLPKKNLIFDLSQDPEERSYVNEFTLDFELKSLARRVALQYVRTYQAFHDSIVSVTEDRVEVDPETLEQLREMGYIQ